MEPPETRTSRIGLAIAVEGGLAALALLLAWVFAIPLREQLTASATELGWAVVRGAMATLPLLALFWWLIHATWPEACRLRQQVERLIEELFPRASLVELAAIAAVAGASEELLFRGVAQSLLARWSTPMMALIVVSLIFGLFHAVSFLYFAVAAAAGAYFGLLMLTFGELVTPIVAHALYDFVALTYLTWELNARYFEAVASTLPSTAETEHERSND
jgi:membrane protease YdiL (CAAX protease family)